MHPHCEQQMEAVVTNLEMSLVSQEEFRAEPGANGPFMSLSQGISLLFSDRQLSGDRCTPGKIERGSWTATHTHTYTGHGMEDGSQTEILQESCR